MINLDGMLMIGSTGANAGKTELACALLGKFSKKHNVVGIKVTTIKDKDGQCPRGGEGCGVCSSLDGNFCITEEFNKNSGKDTSRLLAAGAGRVFWIRSLKEHLTEAMTALLDIIDSETVSICESNSLRLVVEPGLFLMAGNNDSKAWKNSARQVIKYADRIVMWRGHLALVFCCWQDANGTQGRDGLATYRGFDIALERIKLVNGKWTLKEKATAIITAGGSSTRMGADKSMLPIEGKPIIERICERLSGCFEQTLISADNKDKFEFLGFEVVPDKIPGQGPLMAIASALEASSNELNFVVACDIPHIELRHVRRIISEAANSQADIVVPVWRGHRALVYLPPAGCRRDARPGRPRHDEQYEPLFAAYRKNALRAINKVLSSGGRKISDVFALCNVKKVNLGECIVNLNTMAEYEEFKKIHQNQT